MLLSLLVWFGLPVTADTELETSIDRREYGNYSVSTTIDHSSKYHDKESYYLLIRDIFVSTRADFCAP